MGNHSKRHWRKFDGRYSFDLTVADGVVSLDEEDHTPAGGGGVTTCTLAEYEEWHHRSWIAEQMGVRIEQAATRAVAAALGRAVGGLQTLLECGASPDPAPGRSALWLAVERDDPEAVGLLIAAGAEPDAVVDGRTVRALAAERGNADVLAALHGGTWRSQR
mgnify:CR=1 FL=1